MQKTISKIISLSKDIRYIAICRNHKLISQIKQKLANTSSSESDKYEELIVNPTILTLVKQRGEIDCDGAKFVLIRYGKFYQLVIPIKNSHISICIEKTANPLTYVEPINKILLNKKLIIK